MINLPINFHQRLNLNMRLGSIQVQNIKEASVYLRLLDKIRLRDQELIDTKYKQFPDHIEYLLPKEGYGTVHLELEKEESDALIQALNNIQNIRVDEASWMIKLIEDLETQAKDKYGELAPK